MDFRVPGTPCCRHEDLAFIAVVQALNLVVFAWFHRTAALRILVLRQQLAVYQRRSKKPLLKNRDRLFWSWLSKTWKHWKSELILVSPETVVRWRKRKFREFWSRMSQRRPGRPAIPDEHIHFIRRISSDHPEYGEDRIALELELKFGIRHACSTVLRYMLKKPAGPRDSQAWHSSVCRSVSWGHWLPVKPIRDGNKGWVPIRGSLIPCVRARKRLTEFSRFGAVARSGTRLLLLRSRTAS